MKSIKAIFFDLGGVIVHIDSERMKENFRKLGVEHPDALFNSLEMVELNNQFEKNEIEPSEFFSRLQALSKSSVNTQEMIIAWNSLIVEIPFDKIEMLFELRRQGYKVYALSNTNITHVEQLDALCKQARPELTSLRNLFDDVFYSFEAKSRKPDEDFFIHALQSAKVRAEESLFIDDRKDNTDAAKRLGIHILLTQPNLFDSSRISSEYTLLPENEEVRSLSFGHN